MNLKEKIIKDVKEKYDNSWDTRIYISDFMKISDVYDCDNNQMYPQKDPNLEGYLIFYDKVFFANWAHPCIYIFIDTKGKRYQKFNDMPPKFKLEPLRGKNIYLTPTQYANIYRDEMDLDNNSVSIIIKDLDRFISSHYDSNIYLLKDGINNKIELLSKGFSYDVNEKRRHINTLMLMQDILEEIKNQKEIYKNIYESELDFNEFINLCQKNKIDVDRLMSGDLIKNLNENRTFIFTKKLTK